MHLAVVGSGCCCWAPEAGKNYGRPAGRYKFALQNELSLCVQGYRIFLGRVRRFVGDAVSW